MGNPPVVISVISLIVALISLMGVVYGFAVWRGRVDKQLSDYSDAHLLDRLCTIETKLETIWQVFMEQVLANLPNLATRSSSYHLTEDAKRAVEEVKGLIPDINPGCADVAETVLVELPNRIGMDRLREIAEKHQMTMGELLAIISIELGIDL